MGKLKLDDLTKVNDLPYKDIDVPEWGGEVRLKALNVGQNVAIGMARNEDGSELKFGTYMALYLAHSMVNDDGSPFFDSPDAGAAVLESRAMHVVQRLYAEATALNNADDKAETSRQKKSRRTRSGGSSSTSA